MNRDTRMWIVVGIAVVTAALASFGMYQVIARQTKVVEPPKVFVVVARKNLEMGTKVAEEDVNLRGAHVSGVELDEVLIVEVQCAE